MTLKIKYIILVIIAINVVTTSIYIYVNNIKNISTKKITQLILYNQQN